jgi:hypothetical protein
MDFMPPICEVSYPSLRMDAAGVRDVTYLHLFIPVQSAKLPIKILTSPHRAGPKFPRLGLVPSSVRLWLLDCPSP